MIAFPQVISLPPAEMGGGEALDSQETLSRVFILRQHLLSSVATRWPDLPSTVCVGLLQLRC